MWKFLIALHNSSNITFFLLISQRQADVPKREVESKLKPQPAKKDYFANLKNQNEKKYTINK